MYADGLQNLRPDLLTNVRFYDLPNMMGQLTTYLHQQHLHNKMLKDGTYVGKILSTCFNRLVALLDSQYFENLVKTVKGKNYLTRSHALYSADRIFVKQQTDLMIGKQIGVTDLSQLLPYREVDYVVQSEIKKYIRHKGSEYPIYCDVDAMMIHALVELLYYCKYEKNFIEYIVVGSGDKDYSSACKMARECGVLVVAVSFMGEGFSQNMLDQSDIAFILYPKLCIKKPYIYCIEELHQTMN